MPYIKQEIREVLDPSIESLILEINKFEKEDVEGILNYSITRIINNCIKESDAEWRYRHLNRCIGVLECAKIEMYRRLGSFLEDSAIAKNGDLKEYSFYKKFVNDTWEQFRKLLFQ